MAPGLVVVDEAYGQFAPSRRSELVRRRAARLRRLVVVRTFSKTWSMAGLRLGYLVADPEVVRACELVALPYHLDAAKQLAGRLALALRRRDGGPGGHAQRGAGPDRRGPGRAAGRDLAIGRQLHPVPADGRAGPRGVVPPPGPLGPRARLLGVAGARPGACGSPWASPRRTTGSWPPWTKACDDRHHDEPIRPPRTATAARSTKETAIEVALDIDGTGTTEVDDRPPVLRPHARASSAGTAASTSTVAAARRPRRSTPTTRWRTSGSPWARRWPRRWGTRPASGGSDRSPLPLDEALVEVALDLSGRPYLAYDVDFPPETNRARLAAVRPAAGRGVLAGLRHRRRGSRCTSGSAPARTPTTSWRRPSRAWPGRSATRCASRVAASPPPRAPCEVGHRGRRPTGSAIARPPVIAVLDYGIGNLRSAEKALQHLGAEPAWSTTRTEAAGADGVVLPGWAPSAACAQALQLERPGPGGDVAPSSGACPSSGSAWASSCSTKAPRRTRRTPGWGSWPAWSAGCPAGVKHPQMQWNRLEPAGGGPPGLLAGLPTGLGLLRPLLRARSGPPTPSPPVTTAAR